MATKTKDTVVLLSTDTGEISIMGFESNKQVRTFIQEQRRRHHDRTPGGPSGAPAKLFTSAVKFDSPDDIHNPNITGTTINLSEVLGEEGN